MTNEEVLEARNNYCFGKTCRTCIFRTYATGIFNTYCHNLTPDKIYYILTIIKEEESMTKKEEIQKEIEKTQNEIEKTQKQLAALQEKLKEAENEVPDVLPFDIGDELFTVSIDGKVHEFRFTDSKEWDGVMRESHRAFKSKNYAKEFAEKTQLIADMLHFKWLYNRDYKPDLNDGFKCKYCIYYNGNTKKFESGFNTGYSHTESVYFSTNELARRCAEWLNKKYGYTKE